MKTYKKIIIINGPNLNLLGVREPDIYGQEGFEEYLYKLEARYGDIAFEYFQSNIEGEIIDALHQHGFGDAAIILNAGGYTHTSVAISDAIAAIASPVMEVHLSNVYSREEYRHVSLLAKYCVGVISGLGLRSYEAALRYFVEEG